MTHSCGQTPFRIVSFRQPSGLIPVEEMASHLIQRNLYLLKMLWNLLDLRSQMTQFALAGDTSEQSRNFPHLKTSQMSDPGLVCLIRWHMPSAWLNKCFHFETYSSQPHHSTGMIILINYLRNPKP